jgi:hypothetical protein
VSPSLGDLAVLVGPHLVIISSLFRSFGDGSFDAAQSTLAGIERMHMIKKKQIMVETGDEGHATTKKFCSLAASYPYRLGQLSFDDLLGKICDATLARRVLAGAYWAIRSYENRSIFRMRRSPW